MIVETLSGRSRSGSGSVDRRFLAASGGLPGQALYPVSVIVPVPPPYTQRTKEIMLHGWWCLKTRFACHDK